MFTRVVGETMPHYEFFCRRCKKEFSEVMHVEKHEVELPKCPQCHRKNEVEKRLFSFTAVTSRKSAAY